MFAVISEKIISECMKIRQKVADGEVLDWYEVAVAYEATIILRARGNVGVAIDLAEVLYWNDKS